MVSSVEHSPHKHPPVVYLEEQNQLQLLQQLQVEQVSSEELEQVLAPVRSVLSQQLQTHPQHLEHPPVVLVASSVEVLEEPVPPGSISALKKLSKNPLAKPS